MAYYKERKWIRKKLDSGVTQKQLLNGVGIWSNKSKDKVKAEKNINNKQYEKRRGFLGNVYYLLNSYDFER